MAGQEAEQLRPEETVNPTLNRFYAFMAARVVDQNAAAPDIDPLTSRIMLQNSDSFPKARSALAAARDAFPVKLPVSLLPQLKTFHQGSDLQGHDHHTFTSHVTDLKFT